MKALEDKLKEIQPLVGPYLEAVGEYAGLLSETITEALVKIQRPGKTLSSKLVARLPLGEIPPSKAYEVLEKLTTKHPHALIVVCSQTQAIYVFENT